MKDDCQPGMDDKPPVRSAGRPATSWWNAFRLLTMLGTQDPGLPGWQLRAELGLTEDAFDHAVRRAHRLIRCGGGRIVCDRVRVGDTYAWCYRSTRTIDRLLKEACT